jgi:cell division protein FtsQ
LTQRVPVVRVQTAVDTYLIDRDRKVMPIRSSVRDHVLVATGNVGVQIAGGQIADFAEWTADEPYWRERIHHLYVQTPKMIYLYLKDEKGMKEERIVLGSLKEYEKKLKKLKTFYLNSPQEVKDKHYTELDLRYEGQVIGRY